MQLLTTFSCLQNQIGLPITLPAESIPLSTVSLFGELTGDKNDHNVEATQKFVRPAAQGFLSLSLFADFHKRICRIENADPINVRIIETRFLRPVYVDEPITPKLTIKSAEQKSDHIVVIWKYELLNTASKKLVFAEIELRYYFTTNHTHQ